MLQPMFTRLATAEIALVAFLVAAGCDQTAPSESDTSAGTDRVATADSRDPPQPAEEATPANPAVKDDPAAGLQSLAEALAAGRARQVAEAVPARYHAALDHWWINSVQSIESSSRREAAEAAAAFADALASKSEFVLESDRVELEGVSASLVRRRFDAIARAISSIARWPGWSSENDSVDSAGLIAVIAQAVSSEPGLQDELRSLRFETVSRSPDRATVRVEQGRGRSAFDVTLVRIEGCWVPQALADRVSRLPSPDKESATPVEPAERAKSLRTLAQQLIDATTAVERVANQEDFNAQIDRTATLLMAAAAKPTARPVGEEERVTVHVLGTLAEDDKDRLLWAFVSQTDAPVSGVAEAIDRPAGDGLDITIGPVADVETFARSLPDVSIEKIDRETRTITVRIGEP